MFVLADISVYVQLVTLAASVRWINAHLHHAYMVSASEAPQDLYVSVMMASLDLNVM